MSIDKKIFKCPNIQNFKNNNPIKLFLINKKLYKKTFNIINLNKFLKKVNI